MSDDASDNQLVPMQAKSAKVDDLFEDDKDSESQFEDVTGSTDPVDAATDAHAAALMVLPPGDVTFAQEALDVKGRCETSPGHEEQHEDFHESIEDDPQPETQSLVQARADTAMSDHHHDDGDDPEPEQQAQRVSHQSIDHDTTMVDMPDEMDSTAPTTVINPQPSVNANTASRFARENSTSLFIPERHSPSRSPAPLPMAPRLSAAPPHPTQTPAHEPEAPGGRLSIFAKVRNMQKLAQARRNTFNKHAIASQPSTDLDPEAYLEAVTSGNTPPAGALPDVNEDEMAHRHALAEFQKQKRLYDKVKEQHNGRLPLRQDVEWMKIKGAEDARLKKRQRDFVMAQENDGQDIFPQVHSHDEERNEEFGDGFFGEGSFCKRRRGEQPRKQSKPVSIQDAELRAMRVALEASADLPKKKKKGAAGLEDTQEPRPSAKSRGSKPKTALPSRGKAAGKSAAKGPRKTAKGKRELERATKQATSLFNANVFEQQAEMGAADQPTLRTMKKAEALKELIASVPIQDKKQVRNDMNILLQASKDFDGVGACKIAPGGNWMVRGMKTSLKGYQVLGSAFMRRRENDTQEPRGGLMADQMGLGKTLMTLGECNCVVVLIRVQLLITIS